jgi:hypothetical protein
VPNNGAFSDIRQTPPSHSALVVDTIFAAMFFNDCSAAVVSSSGTLVVTTQKRGARHLRLRLVFAKIDPKDTVDKYVKEKVFNNTHMSTSVTTN